MIGTVGCNSDRPLQIGGRQYSVFHQMLVTEDMADSLLKLVGRTTEGFTNKISVVVDVGEDGDLLYVIYKHDFRWHLVRLRHR